MEVEIREAGLKDYEGVSRLMKVLVGESVRERKEAWKKALRMGNYIAFVAEVKGRVVGFIDLFYFPWVCSKPDRGRELQRLWNRTTSC